MVAVLVVAPQDAPGDRFVAMDLGCGIGVFMALGDAFRGELNGEAAACVGRAARPASPVECSRKFTAR